MKIKQCNVKRKKRFQRKLLLLNVDFVKKELIFKKHTIPHFNFYLNLYLFLISIFIKYLSKAFICGHKLCVQCLESHVKAKLDLNITEIYCPFCSIELQFGSIKELISSSLFKRWTGFSFFIKFPYRFSSIYTLKIRNFTKKIIEL